MPAWCIFLCGICGHIYMPCPLHSPQCLWLPCSGTVIYCSWYATCPLSRSIHHYVRGSFGVFFAWYLFCTLSHSHSLILSHPICTTVSVCFLCRVCVILHFYMMCVLFISVCCVWFITMFSCVRYFPCSDFRALCMSVLIGCAGLIDWLVWIDWLVRIDWLAPTTPAAVLRRQGHFWRYRYRSPIQLVFTLNPNFRTVF